MDSTTQTLLHDGLILGQQQLQSFVQGEDFWTVFEDVFGTEYDRTQAEAIQQAWLSGDFSQLPEIEVLDAASMPGIQGGFSAQTGKIYINSDFLANSTVDRIAAVLIEEIGHSLDSRINVSDTPGDEGELFAKRVLGVTLTDSELIRIQTEDDYTTVSFDGQSIQIEQATTKVYLSDLTHTSTFNSWGPIELDRSNGEQAAGDGKVLTINGTTYAKGLGVHAISDISYTLGGRYTTFNAFIGIDDEVGSYGSVVFKVLGDNSKVLFTSSRMTGLMGPQGITVNVTGQQTLQLIVDGLGDLAHDHADWADANLLAVTQNAPSTITTTSGSSNYVENNSGVVIDPGLSINGSNMLRGAKISIGTNFNSSQDRLLFNNQLGISGSYDATTGILSLSGTTSIENYQTALRSVKYSNNSDAPTTGDRKFTFSLNSAFYEYIPNRSGISWTDAKTAADKKTFLGLQGYLATITSADENSFIKSEFVNVSEFETWIGASDAAVESEWRWVTGPEGLEESGKGRLFSRNFPNQVINNQYSNWNEGEANNKNVEDYAHLYRNGTWNDIDGSFKAQGYVVEYGGMPNDPVLVTGSRTMTITAVNDAAVIGGTIAGTVVEAGGVSNAIIGTPTATGNLDSTDVDNTADAWTAVTTATSSTMGYGTYTMDAAGVWTYTLDNSNAAVQGLNNSQTLIDTFTVATVDGTTQTVTVNATGANDAAVIGGTIAGTVVEAGGVSNAIIGTPTATGNLDSTDVDNTADAWTAVTTATSSTMGYGTYTMDAAGVWTYTLNNSNAAVQGLNNSQTLIDTFTVATVDGTTQTVTVNATGANDAAVIGTPSNSTVTEDLNADSSGNLTAAGTISISDVDQGQATFKTAVTAAPDTLGTLALVTDGIYTYTVANSAVQYLGAGKTKSDTFTVESADGTPKAISFTINGVNDAPTKVGQGVDDQIIPVNESLPQPLNLSTYFTDVDQGDSLTFTTTSLPPGLTLTNGIISGTPSTIGIFNVKVEAKDISGAKVVDDFDLVVANNNATPGNDIIDMTQLVKSNGNLSGEAGDDRVYGTSANNMISGAQGNDYLDGRAGDDKLLGAEGNDTLIGGLGNDDLQGGQGNDTLTGWGSGTGSANQIDRLFGASGKDTYVLGNSTSVFYSSGGDLDYAQITQFDVDDLIQLKGPFSNYSLGSVPSSVSASKSSVGIFTNSGTELIAVVNDGLNLTTNLEANSRFMFV